MLESMLRSSEWTSANPTHTNTFIQANALENPDFEGEIEKLLDKNDGNSSLSKKVKNDEKAKTQDKKLTGIAEKIEAFNKGPVGKIQKFSTEQFGNIKGVASNPVGFIFGKLGTKLVRGGVILGLILLIEQIIQFVIDEGMKPNRWLDRRLRVSVEDQVLSFTRRQELADLRQGFRSVFITASPFMRGSVGNIGSSLAPAPGSEISRTFQDTPVIKSNVGGYTSKNRPGESRR
jgi:hypothetical protein